MKLAMPYDEIKVRFMQAKDKKQQVHILAELNACSTAQIVDVLRATKVDGRLLRYLDKSEPGTKKRDPTPEEAEPERAESSSLDTALAIIRAEIDDINRQQYELDMKKADLYQRIWDMLGEV